MRRVSTVMVALAVIYGGVVLMAQKASTPEDLDMAMKKVGPAQQAANKAIMSGSFADAKTQVQTLRQALADAENFWVVKKKDDAMKMSQEAIAKVSALDAALSAPTPDATAVGAAFREIGATCRNCHMAYRVQDENMAYILKPGAV